MSLPYPIKLFWLIILLILDLHLNLSAQPPVYRIDRTYNHLDLLQFIAKAEQNLGVRFYYQNDTLPTLSLTIENDSMLLEEALNKNLKPHSVFVTIDPDGNIFLTKGIKIKTALPSEIFGNQQLYTLNDTSRNEKENYLPVKNEIGIKTMYVGDKKNESGKNVVTLSGHLTGKSKGISIMGASLYFEELKTGVVSDINGFYSMQLGKGTYKVTIKSLEYEEKKFRLVIYADGKLDISLDEKVNSLKEVVILSEGSNNLKTTTMGYERISSKNIKTIPKMMGENDLVKTTLLLPGVQSVGEGTAGFNVRGSPADQNVFYLSQIPVYNTSHLMGFFSAFTPNAISDLTLYKGNFPAQFGGHLSSVFDLTAREGNNKKFSAEGGISPVTGNLLAEGPITKGKSSYLIGARSTYSDWALKLVKVDAIRNSRARFKDGVANFTLGLNDKNRMNIVGYYSNDHIILANITDYDYENIGSAIKWNHFIRQKHNLELSTIYSNYKYNEQNNSSDRSAYKINYKLSHLEVKTGLVIVPTIKHRLQVGANSIMYQLDNGSYEPLHDRSLIKPLNLKSEQGIESGVYINEEWKPSTIFSLSAGLRYNFYTFLGPHTSYIYRQGTGMELENISDTINYKKNAAVKSYSAPDLRLSAKYSINEFMSLKAAFSQVHQYIFMLSNTISVSPTDKWKLVDDHIKPMNGQQYAVGFVSEMKKHMYEFSTELYYKKINNLIEYKDGANLLVNPVPETDVLQGDLKSYGAEFMFKKITGKLNGWLSYTYSRAIVRVNGELPGEKINFGNPFPVNYDKPHAANVVINYKFTHRFSISSNVVYATGRPITYPAAFYYQQGVPVIHYSARNESRIPDYFRVDISVSIEGNLKAKKFKHSFWNFSVYNLLGRDNPYSVYFKQENNLINGYKLSIFGDPIFSITYNFKLGNYEN